jgi:two-component system, NarL family, response regulator NreC
LTRISVTTIFLADDHDIVRHGMRALLSVEADFTIIGEAASGVGLTDLVERLRPEVLILDLMMPGLNGLEVVRQITQRNLKTRVVVLSMHANEAYVLEALRNGALGYVLKDNSTTDLVLAVRAVAVGQHFLSAPLSARAVASYAERAGEVPPDPYETLTGREREVLQLVAEGLSSPEVAERLSLSPRTAEAHRANLMRKLGLHNQTELIRFAIRRGVIAA